MHTLRIFFIAAMLSGCAHQADNKEAPSSIPLPERSYPNEPADFPREVDSALTVIKDATLYPITAAPIDRGYIVMEAGKIVDVGAGEAPNLENALVIDAKGAFVTPGVIDTHSHMGVYANPSVRAHSDGNEMVGPVTADVWAEHGFWPQDPSIRRALSGGVTKVL